MTRTVVGLLVPMVLLPALQARDKPEKQTPAQQYQALVKEVETAVRELERAFKEAKTPQDKQKIRKETITQLSKYYPRFLDLAEKNPKDPEAMDALIWVISSNRDLKYDPQSPRTKALKVLLRDHVKNEKMATVCQLQRGVTISSDEESRQLLRAVLENNPHSSARAQACLALAEQSENRLRLARLFKDQPEITERYESMVGKGALEALVKADLDELRKEAEIYYERIVKDFAVVAGARLAKIVEAKLDALRHPISVGKPTPEIEGEDIDGKEFKLSDSRGKVVLLVFWGNWLPPCRAMYPHERSLVKRLEGKAFVLLGVNSDRDRAEVKTVMDKEEITWRSFWNGGSTQGRISSRWDVQGWPTLFLIDAKGVVRHKFVGSPGDKKLDEEIDKLIAEVEKPAAK